MVDLFIFSENNSSATSFIVSSYGTFVKRETTSKLTNFCPDENWYECNLLTQSSGGLSIYSCGMWGFVILSKNFANLYASFVILSKNFANLYYNILWCIV